MDRSVIDHAIELTQNYRLRGYDAVQLATAWVANETLISQNLPPLVFVASDDDILTAAKAQKLLVNNPLDHADLDSLPTLP